MGDATSYLSIIDRDLCVEGDLACTGKLIIKGEVRGNIVGDTVIVAAEGIVTSEVRVKRLTIGGRFEGEIEAVDQLTILSTGYCTGRVVCNDLIVEAGAHFNAEVVNPKVSKIETRKMSDVAEPVVLS